jgi:hypothetical protein
MREMRLTLLVVYILNGVKLTNRVASVCGLPSSCFRTWFQAGKLGMDGVSP